MTTAQTEARATAERLMLPDEDVFNLAVDIIATALAAKDAELATLHEADGNFWEAIARAERAEAEMAATKVDRDDWINRCRASVMAFDEQKARAERAEAQLAEARKALEWHPIETAPLNTIVDLWCTYADAPASWGNDRPAGQIVHNRHKSKEHGWFGNESNDGIPQANGPDLVPVAWRWPAPEIPLEMMERFVAARALEEQGGENAE